MHVSLQKVFLLMWKVTAKSWVAEESERPFSIFITRPSVFLMSPSNAHTTPTNCSRGTKHLEARLADISSTTQTAQASPKRPHQPLLKMCIREK